MCGTITFVLDFDSIFVVAVAVDFSSWLVIAVHYIGDLCNVFRSPAKTDNINFEIVEDKMLLFVESSRLVSSVVKCVTISVRERGRAGSVFV